MSIYSLLADDFCNNAIDLLNNLVIEVRERRPKLDQVWIRRIMHNHNDKLMQADKARIAPRRRYFGLRQTFLNMGTHKVAGLRTGFDQPLPLQQRVGLEHSADA